MKLVRYIHCTGQFTPKMKANAEPRLLSSLVWIDSGVVMSQHHLESFVHEIKCNGMTSFIEFTQCIVWAMPIVLLCGELFSSRLFITYRIDLIEPPFLFVTDHFMNHTIWLASLCLSQPWLIYHNCMYQIFNALIWLSVLIQMMEPVLRATAVYLPRCIVRCWCTPNWISIMQDLYIIISHQFHSNFIVMQGMVVYIVICNVILQKGFM